MLCAIIAEADRDASGYVLGNVHVRELRAPDGVTSFQLPAGGMGSILVDTHNRPLWRVVAGELVKVNRVVDGPVRAVEIERRVRQVQTTEERVAALEAQAEGDSTDYNRLKNQRDQIAAEVDADIAGGTVPSE